MNTEQLAHSTWVEAFIDKDEQTKVKGWFFRHHTMPIVGIMDAQGAMHKIYGDVDLAEDEPQMMSVEAMSMWFTAST